MARGTSAATAVAAEASPPRGEPDPMPWYTGYPPPPEVLERAEQDPWLAELLGQKKRRHWWPWGSR